MKNRFLLACLSLGLATTLQAGSFFFNDEHNYHKQFQHELNQFFNDDSFFSFPYKHYKINFTQSYPKLNIFENKKDYTLKFELAGIDKKDIKVTITDQNMLTITGKKQELSKEEKKNLLVQEHSYGEFTRTISLPDNIDNKNIKVTYENGVLQIVIQKDEKKNKKGVRTLQID
ncbi:MAG: Hsp20/alpha crystallin family protein [Arcobacteraceae bacterium]